MGQMRVYTPDEARAILRIGRSRAYELLRSGELKSVKNGRRYLIPKQCIVEYLRGKAEEMQKEGGCDG